MRRRMDAPWVIRTPLTQYPWPTTLDAQRGLETAPSAPSRLVPGHMPASRASGPVTRRSRPMTAGRRVAAFLFALPMAVTVPIAAAATPPSPPPIVRAVAVTPSQIVLEWESGGPDVTSYTVRRDGSVLASVNPATLTFSDDTVLAGHRYAYVVEAVGPGGTAASAAIRVKTPSPPERQDHNRPTVPEDVHAVAMADGSVLVDWQGSNDDSDISAYVIRRGNRHVATVNSGTLAFIDTRKDSARGSYTVEAVDITGLRSGRSDEAPVETTTAGATAASPGTRSSGTAAQTGSLSTAAFSASLRRYPYLTDVVNSADSTTGYATINWATDRSSTSAAAVWGAVAGDGSCSPTTSVAGTRTPITVNSVALYQWEANLTLLPDQAYCYRVTLGGADLLGSDPSPRFRTLLPTGSTTPFSFAVLGDWGQVDESSSNPDQANLMQRIAQSGVSFAVTTGDNAYASGSQGNYGDLVETGPELSAVFGPQFWTVAGSSIPMFPAIGNHGFLRNDAAHPHFTNWPQDRAVSEFERALPARYVLLSARDVVPDPAEHVVCLRCRADADLRPPGCLVRLERWRQRRPVRGRRRLPMDAEQRPVPVAPAGPRCPPEPDQDGCVPLPAVFRPEARDLGHLPPRRELTAGPPQPVRRQACLQRPRAHLPAQLRGSGRHGRLPHRRWRREDTVRRRRSVSGHRRIRDRLVQQLEYRQRLRRGDAAELAGRGDPFPQGDCRRQPGDRGADQFARPELRCPDLRRRRATARRHRGAERADRGQRGGRLVVARQRVVGGLDRQRRRDRLRRPARRRRHRVGVRHHPDLRRRDGQPHRRPTATRWWPRTSPATSPVRASRPASPRRPRATPRRRACRPGSARWPPRRRSSTCRGRPRPTTSA